MTFQNPLLAIALLAASAPIAAQTRATMTMGGILMPSSCKLSMVGAGVLSFGDIDYSSLNETTTTEIPSRSIKALFQCTGPTRFFVTLADNRHDSSTAPTQAHAFGLGRTVEGKLIGMYRVETDTPLVNGAPSTMISSTTLQDWRIIDDTVPWGKISMDGRQFRSFGSAAGPVPMMEASMNLRITPNINPRNQLLVTQKAALNGSATLTIEYL